jgi:hypothetical protein
MPARGRHGHPAAHPRPVGKAAANCNSQPAAAVALRPLPWCVQKCPYCDFNSHALPARQRRRWPCGDSPKADYLAALIADLEAALPLVWGRRVTASFSAAARPACSRARVSTAAGGLAQRLPLLPERRDHAGSQSGNRRGRKNSPPFAPPASTACRSASRASTRATSRRSAASTTIAKPGARSRLPPALRQRSTST